MSKVSVILPVYNVADCLRAALDSVLSQTLAELEIICIDDGSTDGSGPVLDAYAARDARMRVVHQPNRGAGPARNVGLDLATGDYLFFFDPDDRAAPEMLERLYARAVAERADVVCAGRLSARCFRGHPIVTRADAVLSRLSPSFRPSDCADELFCAARPALWDKLFSRALVNRCGLRFPALLFAEDTVFTLSALARAERIAVEDEGYYIHWSGRAGSLRFQKDKAPLALVEAYDALREALRRDGLLATFGRGLGAFLVDWGARCAIGFRDRKNLDLFYAVLRERLATAAEHDADAVWTSPWQRRMARRVLASPAPDAFVAAARRRQFVRRLQKALRLSLGLPIREV